MLGILISRGNLLHLLSQHKTYAPILLLEEVERHLPTVMERVRCGKRGTAKLLRTVRRYITFIDNREFECLLPAAERCCPDPKDVAYFALALHLKCPLWSNDKRLKEQDAVEVVATHELP